MSNEHRGNPRESCVDMGTKIETADQHEQETFAPLHPNWPEINTHIADTLTADNAALSTVGEADPSGLDAHSPGAKLDAGKCMVDDILAGFPRALMGIADVGTFGANKYTLNGWQSVENGIRRYRNAAGRHRLKIQMGEEFDADSGLPHRFHEAWNVLAALELELRSEEEQ